MGVLRDRLDRKKRQMAEEDSKMAAEDLAYTIEQQDDGKYYVRNTRRMRVWSQAGCEKTIIRRMQEGEGWAERFWAETNAWMTNYVNGVDPMFADWATECWNAICTAYEKVMKSNAPRDIELAAKRGECGAEIFGGKDPYVSARDECFGESESFGESPGMESFGDTEETFGETEGAESFGEEESFG